MITVEPVLDSILPKGIEVRCSGDVARRLGWIFVPPDTPIVPGLYSLPSTGRASRTTLELRRFSWHCCAEADRYDSVAFAAGDLSVDALRQIDGFVEDHARMRSEHGEKEGEGKEGTAAAKAGNPDCGEQGDVKGG